jgi:PTH1 family peptidyl-tRNA hydrolase
MMYLVGLGNPGAEYDGTRHNVGAAVLERYLAAHSFPALREEKKWQASVAQGVIGSASVTALIPLTYMNHSGQAVAAALRYAGAGSVVALYDDVDLPVGTFKISVQGGAAGHNGVKSLIGVLGESFVRVRIGIAPVSFWTGKATRPAGERLPAFVLGRFTARERAAIDALTPTLHEALTCVIKEGAPAAMNRFHEVAGKR